MNITRYDYREHNRKARKRVGYLTAEDLMARPVNERAKAILEMDILTGAQRRKMEGADAQ